MKTTETKKYIEPIGFEGTKGDWDSQYLHDLINHEGDIAYHTLLANNLLLKQSKELVKALQNMLLVFDIAAYASIYSNENKTIQNAKEVLNKSLNINQ